MNRSITRPDGMGASGPGPERRTRSYSRRGRHDCFSRYEVFTAGPTTELVVRHLRECETDRIAASA